MADGGGVLRMKLLVDTKSKRVVFAEAGKDVVDFLFSLLALPLATAVSLFGDRRSVAGSVGSLYASVQALDACYLLPGADRNDLLRPAIMGSAAEIASSSLSMLLPPPPSKTFFLCHRCGGGGGGYLMSWTTRRFVTDVRGALCPNCCEPMTAPLQYTSPSPSSSSSSAAGSSPVQWAPRRAAVAGGGPSTAAAAAKGFVQGAVTYTVKDDLTITPMSTISSMTLVRAYAATDLAAFEEMNVHIGFNEGLDILKASLKSKTVVTDVFL